jgi:hypothetical protein
MHLVASNFKYWRFIELYCMNIHCNSLTMYVKEIRNCQTHKIILFNMHELFGFSRGIYITFVPP